MLISNFHQPLRFKSFNVSSILVNQCLHRIACMNLKGSELIHIVINIILHIQCVPLIMKIKYDQKLY